MTATDQTKANSIPIPATLGRPAQRHVFEADSLDALDAALAARRPLLVYGEPGIGKSQLALAAALRFQHAYVHTVLDAHTEARELLWHHDAVARLAEAQLQGALPNANEEALRESLKLIRYIRPGPLWWAFNWQSAQDHLDSGLAIECGPPTQPDPEICQPGNGCVLLIDEIDKAESDVPNGLLEALGAGGFPVPGRSEPVSASGKAPLVIITSNGERSLPEAFVRRCLVLHLGLPDVAEKPEAFKDRLIACGRAHFEQQLKKLDDGDTLLRDAAELLAEDRLHAQQNQWRPLPGQAEYLDLLRAVLEVNGESADGWREVLGRISDFVLKKHPDAAAAALARRADQSGDQATDQATGQAGGQGETGG